METIDNSTFEKSGAVSDVAFESMRSTIPWIKFIAITGFILLGFGVISTLYQIATSYGYMRYMGWTYVIYLVLGAVFFFLNLFLFQYANNLAHFTRSKQSFDLELALEKQKTFYIISAILLIVYILVVIIALIWAMSQPSYSRF
jgi:hypothetical protein